MFLKGLSFRKYRVWYQEFLQGLFEKPCARQAVAPSDCHVGLFPWNTGHPQIF